MNLVALLIATAAGVAGALIWGGLSAATNFEIGYVAWAIGLLVGGAARWMGGKGQSMAVLCAGLALVSIFAGKVLAVQWSAPAQIREALDSMQDDYTELMSDAQAFAELSSPDEHAQFMIDHSYTESLKAEDIPADELEYFRAETIPILNDLYENEPTFEEWRDAQVDMIMKDLDATRLVMDDLNLIDAVFALLGIATAYKLVLGTEE